MKTEVVRCQRTNGPVIQQRRRHGEALLTGKEGRISRISSNRSYVYTKPGEPVLSWQVYQEDDEDSSNRERPRVGEEEGERVGEGGSRNLSQISAGKDNTLACCLDSITRGLIPVPSLSLLAPSLLFIFLSLFPLPPSLSFYVGFISNISIFQITRSKRVLILMYPLILSHGSVSLTIS